MNIAILLTIFAFSASAYAADCTEKAREVGQKLSPFVGHLGNYETTADPTKTYYDYAFTVMEKHEEFFVRTINKDTKACEGMMVVTFLSAENDRRCTLYTTKTSICP